MKKATKLLGLGAALATALALSGCGGGDDTPPVTSQVPATASSSIGGFIDYLQALVVSSADTFAPVDISGVTAPVDETSPPAVLN